MRKLAVVLGLVLLILICMYFYFWNIELHTGATNEGKMYANDRYGVSFTYPSDYRT